MTLQDPTTFDPRIADWLEDDPNTAPDQALDIVLAAFPSIRQRHASRLPWRTRPMNALARMAVAAVVIALAIGGAVYVLAPPNGGVGGPPAPTASPSPRVTTVPSPSPAPSPSLLANGGDIFRGTYIPQFDPSFTFMVADEVEHNVAPNYQGRGNIDANSAGWLYLEFGQPAIEIGVVRVDKLNDPAHPGRLIDPPADLAAWIAGRPGLTVVDQKAVNVGSLAGIQLDVRTGNKDVQVGPIPGVTDVPNGLPKNLVSRVFLVTVHGHQVLIGLVANDGSLDELQPFVDSIVWN